MDPQKPVYDVLPPSVFKLPVDPKETGPEPKAGGRMKLDTEKKVIVIFDSTTEKLVNIPITIVDLQQPIEKDHPLVFDKAENKAKKFPAVDKEKKTITIYSGRQKMLCTFSVPDQLLRIPREYLGCRRRGPPDLQNPRPVPPVHEHQQNRYLQEINTECLRAGSVFPPAIPREVAMSEYRFFLLHKVLVLAINILVLAALSIAMYRASLYPDDFNATFFKTLFSLFIPILLLGLFGKRRLGRSRPSLA